MIEISDHHFLQNLNSEVTCECVEFCGFKFFGSQKLRWCQVRAHILTNTMQGSHISTDEVRVSNIQTNLKAKLHSLTYSITKSNILTT